MSIEKSLLEPILNNKQAEEKKEEIETLTSPEERKSMGDDMDEKLQTMLGDEKEKTREFKKLEAELGPEHDKVIALREELEFLQEQIELDQEGLEDFIEDIKDSDEPIIVTPKKIAIQNRASRIEAIRTELENLDDDAKAEELTQELNGLAEKQAMSISKDGKI